MEEDGYYLKWEKHHNAFVSLFDYLYKHEILVDCTLVAEDKSIKAHRIVLMACSPYLQKTLREHSENYTVLSFDMKYSILEAIVHFCYHGEVKVAEDKLELFLEAAKVLKIRGLCRDSVSDDVVLSDDNCASNKRRLSVSDSNTVNSVVANKKAKFSNNDSDNRLISDEVIELPSEDADRFERNGFSSHPLSVVKSEPDDSLAREAQGSDDDNSDVDSDDSGDSGPNGDHVDAINDLLSNSSTILFPWTCNRCGEAFPTRAPYEEHRRNCARSDPISHPWKCHKCANAYKNKKDLVRHLYYCGNDTPRLYCNRCGNSYKYERGLRRHQKYCGTDVKPLKCPQCEKTYKYKRGLRRHQRRCGIAEALQFLAGKGVTPVVVTKRSLGLPYLGEISRAGLPIATAPQLAQLTYDKGIRRSDITDPNIQQHTLDPSVFNPALLSEPSVCQCGKVYKYKKSYDKHVASCSCNPNRKPKRGRRSRKHTNGRADYVTDNEEEDENENNEEEEEDEEREKIKQNGHNNQEDEEEVDDDDEEEESYIIEVLEPEDEEAEEQEESKDNQQEIAKEQKSIDDEEKNNQEEIDDNERTQERKPVDLNEVNESETKEKQKVDKGEEDDEEEEENDNEDDVQLIEENEEHKQTTKK